MMLSPQTRVWFRSLAARSSASRASAGQSGCGGGGHYNISSAFHRHGSDRASPPFSSHTAVLAAAEPPSWSSSDESSDEEAAMRDDAALPSAGYPAWSSDESFEDEGNKEADAHIVKVAHDGGSVTIQFRNDDGSNNNVDEEYGDDDSIQSESSTYHASWLWSNDPRRIFLPSGQRATTPGQWRANSRPRIRGARIIHCNIEQIKKEGLNDGVHHADKYYESKAGSDAFISTEKGITVPGPTLDDSCHPLPVYGEHPAWIMATTTSTSDASPANNGRAPSCRPYLQIVWTATPSASASSAWSAPSSPQTGTADHESTSIYDIEWLERFRYDNPSRLKRLRRSEVRPIHAIRNDGPPLWYATPESRTKSRLFDTEDEAPNHDGSDGLMHVDYHTIIGKDGDVLKEGLFRLLHSVFSDGAAIVSNTPFSHDHTKSSASTNINHDNSVFQLQHTLGTMPKDDLPVSKVAKAMSGGTLSHGSLYGDTFHVRVGERDSNNVAYTFSPLPPHQDMAYYESPPGMQLLHCAIMGPGVAGGESTLIDGLAAAHRLRELRPASFGALAQCPATFVKQRDGAGMTYRRPHIGLSEEGIYGLETTTEGREITAVHWSPPFEGPACLPPGQVDRYYEAYADFERLLNGGDRAASDEGGSSADDGELSAYAREHTWERKLRPGDMLVFNNRRMLHGRRGFSVAEGACFEDGQRHLVGCYTNIDDTLNSYRVLLRERGAASVSILNVGNGTNIIP